jgi:hypothetical protein
MREATIKALAFLLFSPQPSPRRKRAFMVQLWVYPFSIKTNNNGLMVLLKYHETE